MACSVAPVRRVGHCCSGVLRPAFGLLQAVKNGVEVTAMQRERCTASSNSPSYSGPSTFVSIGVEMLARFSAAIAVNDNRFHANRSHHPQKLPVLC